VTAPYNPYAPPAQQPSVAPPAPDGRERLASLGSRFGGAFIDGLFALVVGFTPAFALAAADLDPFPRAERAMAWMPSQLLLQLCALVPNAIQWALVTTSGQTLGKKALDMRIVRVTGAPAGFVHGVALRMLPFFFLGAVTPLIRPLGGGATAVLVYSMVTMVVAFVDPLFIFRSDRRCLHDLIAGTEVIAL
jgi:uncharacterized RDD family membrane protein YckC